MYLDKVFYDENSRITEVSVICNKCGTFISVFNIDIFQYTSADLCLLKPTQIIKCQCGNEHTEETVTFKPITKLTDCIRNKTIQVQNIPKCPTCNSTNIHKITGTERAASVIGLGLISNKINKSFKCNQCGYTW